MPDGETVPIYRRCAYAAGGLALGFHGERIDFDYRPYEHRSAEARADYDRLKANLEINGMRNPLITYQGHVLIGMRRYEIMVGLGQTDFECIEILEDVNQWWQDGPPKLEALKRALYVEC